MIAVIEKNIQKFNLVESKLKARLFLVIKKDKKRVIMKLYNNEL